MSFIARQLINRVKIPSRAFASAPVPSWATIDPDSLSDTNIGRGQNIVGGVWTDTKSTLDVVDPLTGDVFLKMPNTDVSEIDPFVESLTACPKSGLHNPFKNPERYLMLGDVSQRVAAMMKDDDVADFLARCIQRVVPKSYAQCLGEVVVTRKFFENFSGDQVRFLARSFGVPGDHTGQMSNGYRVPFGPCALICPFNFPIEIPLLQTMGALYMGNKLCVHVDAKVAIVFEQCLRMLHAAGLPTEDIDMMTGRGVVMNELLLRADPPNTLFTGSSQVAEKLALDMRGRIRIEDAGFDWKILGPDVGDVDYVAYVCDQDAYAASGQKCSAQSILFMHSNWEQAGLLGRLKGLAQRRTLQNLTVGPVITVTTQRIQEHIAQLLQIPGARVLFGGEPLQGHSIPPQYGAMEPTAVFVPLEEMMKPGHFELATTEIFGPFQIVTEYDDSSTDTVLAACEGMKHHLTAACVSNDVHFVNRVVSNTVNGTTYVGRRARTTGAPQNHWFGPAGDPRAAGIGTPEAIKVSWSAHREIIQDIGPVDPNWTTPACT